MWHKEFSNFYLPADHPGIVYEGFAYPTIEHFFVAMKTQSEVDRRKVLREIDHPAEAKKFGNTVVLRPDWKAVRHSVMLYALRQKFRHPVLLDLLLADLESEIVHEVHWHDNYWAACVCAKCANREKFNWLGQHLMKIRAEFSQHGIGAYLRNGQQRQVYFGTAVRR